MKILVPYVEDNASFKKAIWSLEKYTPKDVEIVKIHDEARQGMSVVFNKYFTGEDDLILWHSDMYATEKWYEALQEHLSEKAFDITGMKLIYPNGLIQFYGGFIRSDGCGVHAHQHCFDIGLDEPMSCTYATWGGVYLNKEVIKAVGKIDEQFFQAYYGDVDYCMRALQAGFTVGVVPVKIIHEESKDNNQNPNLQRILSTNFNIFKAKYQNYLAEKLQ